MEGKNSIKYIWLQYGIFFLKKEQGLLVLLRRNSPIPSMASLFTILGHNKHRKHRRTLEVKNKEACLGTLGLEGNGLQVFFFASHTYPP